MAKTFLICAAAAALSLGFSLQPHPAPFWESNIVIAAEEMSPTGTVQADEGSSAVESAQMGKDEGTQKGGAYQGMAESDTQKVDQPRKNPTPGD